MSSFFGRASAGSLDSGGAAGYPGGMSTDATDPTVPTSQATGGGPRTADGVPAPRLEDRDGRAAVVVSRLLPHPPEEVWEGVTRPVLLEPWFPGAPVFTLREGGTARFPAFGEGPEGYGQMLEVEHGERLRFTWGGEEMTLALRPEGDGTLLTITQLGDDRPGTASYATGWEACLEGLAQVLAGQEVTDPGPRPARHEELAAAFGLDRPVLAEDAQGWVLRWSRQLVVPAETAWELWLAGGDPAGHGPDPEIDRAFRSPRAPEVVLGTVTALDPPRLLVLEVDPAEPGEGLRVATGEGTGHGTRLEVVLSGTDAAEREAGREQWTAAVAGLAAAALHRRD